MQLPSPTDIELQLALLNAISQCADSTAVAEELRPVAEKALSLTIPEDQKEEWTNLISWALINMRDQKVWLQSPHHEPGTTGASPESQVWIKTNRPSADPKQRIWKISAQGVKVLLGGPQNDPTVPRKKLTKMEHAGQLMWDHFEAHRSELPKNIGSQREFIIDLLMKGKSAEDAFAMAMKSMI